MKTIFVKMGILSCLSMMLLVTSCSKEDDSTVTEEQTAALTAEQSKQSAEADASVDAVFNLLEIAYAEEEESDGRNASLFTDCVIITISSENNVTFVSLDFGVGCVLNNGALVAGIINLSYGDVVAGTRNITYLFEDFSYNLKEIAGGGTIFRERNNSNGNPQSTVNKEVEVTFPNGVVANLTGTRVAEWVEGVGSGSWSDNVFLITGDRQIVFSSGFTHNALVLEALRREASCPHFVSGVLELTRNSGSGTLDFGDGTCDNIAVLTVGNQEYIITL